MEAKNKHINYVGLVKEVLDTEYLLSLHPKRTRYQNGAELRHSLADPVEKFYVNLEENLSSDRRGAMISGTQQIMKTVTQHAGDKAKFHVVLVVDFDLSDNDRKYFSTNLNSTEFRRFTVYGFGEIKELAEKHNIDWKRVIDPKELEQIENEKFLAEIEKGNAPPLNVDNSPEYLANPDNFISGANASYPETPEEVKSSENQLDNLLIQSRNFFFVDHFSKDKTNNELTNFLANNIWFNPNKGLRKPDVLVKKVVPDDVFFLKRPVGGGVSLIAIGVVSEVANKVGVVQVNWRELGVIDLITSFENKDVINQIEGGKLDIILEELVSKEKNIFNIIDSLSLIEVIENNYWWLNIDASINIDEWKEGSEGFTIFTELSSRPESFQKRVAQIKANDLGIIYYPTKKGEIKFVIKVDKISTDGKLEYHLIKEFKGDAKKSINELKELPNFKSSEVVKSNNEEDLLQLSREEFTELRNLNATPPKSKPNRSTIAGVTGDGTGDEDYFEIDKDVESFAKIIASSNFKPPLAIALFGQWGTGKSFFMNKMTEKIKKLAQGETDLENPTYCTGVVQIHFNAWSYLDSNLWAALVSTIFEKLNEYLTNSTKSGVAKLKVKEKLVERITSLKSTRLTTAKKQEGLELIVDEYKNEKIQLEKNIQKSITNHVIDIIDQNDELKGLHDKLIDKDKSITEVIGISDSQFVQEYSFWVNFYSNLKNFKNLKWYILSTVVIITVLFGLTQVTEVFNDLKITYLLIITPILSKMGVDIELVRRRYFQVKKYVASLNSVLEGNDENQEKIKLLEKLIFQKQDEISEVDTQLDGLNEKIDSLEYKINKNLTGETISDFILNRVNHSDYKKHLGIVSTIRKDFELLSELFLDLKNEENKNDDSGDSSALKRDKLIIEEQFLEGKKMERIVLYIDDLDRCEEDRVIEVLEAVNLLMTFPLFVVVVGVDQRWVNNALLKKYHLQFGNGLDDNGKEIGVERIKATDYLEKIFQVPFHLKKAEDHHVKDMLKQLGAPKVEPEDSEEESESFKSQETRDKKDDGGATEVKFSFGGGEISTFEHISEKDEKSTPKEHLELSSIEIELMQDLSEIIGNNPRAIKRFVNVYKIVRAHAGITLNEKAEDKEYLILMFLLAFPMGNYKGNYSEFLSFVNSKNRDRTLSEFINENFDMAKVFSTSDDQLVKPHWYVKMGGPSMKLLLKITAQEFHDRNSFIQRFTFTDIN